MTTCAASLLRYRKPDVLMLWKAPLVSGKNRAHSLLGTGDLPGLCLPITDEHNSQLLSFEYIRCSLQAQADSHPRPQMGKVWAHTGYNNL